MKKQPRVVRLAGITCWIFSLSTIYFHTMVWSRNGSVDVISYAFAGLLLFSGIFWLIVPRSSLFYGAGSISLASCALRSISAAYSLYQSRHQFIDITAQIVGTLVFSLLLIWFAYRFMLSRPSLEYFNLIKPEQEQAGSKS